MIENFGQEKQILDSLIQLTINASTISNEIEKHSKIIKRHDKQLRKLQSRIDRFKSKM